MFTVSIIKENNDMHDLQWMRVSEWKRSIRIGLNTIFKKKAPQSDRTIPPFVSLAAKAYGEYLHNISSSVPKFYCHFFNFLNGLLASDECKKLENILISKYNNGDNDLHMFSVSHILLHSLLFALLL
jgi:hypothetical protein